MFFAACLGQLDLLLPLAKALSVGFAARLDAMQTRDARLI
jgi:hypothetical protein